MEFHEFNLQHNIAKERVRRTQGRCLAEEQERLRVLASQLTDEEDRAAALRLIGRLQQAAEPPRPLSSWMAEALQVREEAFWGGGSNEERIARMEAARNKIWQIADQAPDVEGARIRLLTLSLGHMEESLRDPQWKEPYPRPDDEH